MNPTTQRSAPARAVCAICSAAGTGHTAAVAALLATSRDYFALRAESTDATRAGAAAARRR